MSDNLRRALFGNSRRKPTAAEVVIGAVLDHQTNQQNRRQALPSDPTLPVELQGIIKRSDYQIRKRGHDTECWIWKPNSRLVKDPYADQPDKDEWIQEVVYRRFSGKELPKNGKVIARCGNFDNGGIWDKLWSGQDEEDCINPEHLAVIHKRESDTIKKIRYRKAKEITPEQRQTIAGLGRRRDWTEREQGLIFHVASEDLRNDQDPINQARAKAEQGDYDGAVDDLDQAIEANPNDTAAYLLRALVKTDLGHYKEAVEDFNQAAGISPENPLTYLVENPRPYLVSRLRLLWALVLIVKKDNAGAVASLDEAIEIVPDYARAYRLRSAFKIKLEDYNGAVADRQQAIKLDPALDTVPEETTTISEPEPPSAETTASVQEVTERPRIRVSTREYEAATEPPEIIELDIPPEPDNPLAPNIQPEPETPPEPQTPPEPETPSEPETPPGQSAPAKKNKTVAAVLAFTLGGFGAHKFYLGHKGAGIVHLLLSLTIIGALVNVPICVVEFFIYLSKSEEDFHQTYVVNRRRFF